MDTLRICLWSGPRNVSTALMYSFAGRPDTRVVDEPLYAHYLRVSGAQHPGREDVLAAQDQDGDAVVRDVVLGPCDAPVLFIKHMAHHLVDVDRSFLKDTANVILCRDPEEMLPSLQVQLGAPTLADTGLAVQTGLLRELQGLGQSPTVLDARELLTRPKKVLAELCARLGLEYHAHENVMTHWQAGPRDEDGVWAPHWYHNVHRSTGFHPYRPKTAPFPERLKPVLEECRPHYEELARHALKA